MDIGIIFAMQEEQDAFLSLFKPSQITQSDFNTHIINYNKHTLYIALSGVGKVNAAYTTTLMLEKYPLHYLINSGVAGGIDLLPETIVLSDKVIYHDVDVQAFKVNLPGQIPGAPAYFKSDAMLLEKALKLVQSEDVPAQSGTIASGDQFVTQREPLKAVLAHYDDLYAVEMEAAAIAHVAYLKQVPFLIIRTISDTIDQPAQSEMFSTFLTKASKRSASLLKRLVEAL